VRVQLKRLQAISSQSQLAKALKRTNFPALVFIVFAGIVITAANSNAQESTVSRGPEQPAIVIGTLNSVAADTATQGATVRYKVVRVIDVGNLGLDLREGAVVTEQCSPNESHIPLHLQILSELSKRILLLELTKRATSVEVNRRWTLATNDVQLVTATESAGITDVQKIRRMPTDNERIDSYVQTASATKHPSLVLVLEARRMVDFKTPAAQRFKLVQGLSAIMQRADAPEYVKEYAFTVSGTIGLSDEYEAKRKALMGAILMGHFHSLSAAVPADLPQIKFVLGALNALLRGAPADPQLDTTKKQFTPELMAFEKKLRTEGGAKVSVASRQVNGTTAYEYSGPEDKVAMESLVRPLLDLLGEPLQSAA
jgi:hypothetical protein